MNKFSAYISLARLDKSIGIWLLFLPCLFGTFLSLKYNSNIDLARIASLFFLGSVLMRSAGCVINDIFDRDFDKNVERTQSRPLANGQISLKQALVFLGILLTLSLFILFQFNKASIFLGFGALLLVVIYPLTKRFTYYPQIFLGLTFNFGILIASTAIIGKITLPILLLYFSSIIWTIIYDTLYAYQDIEDDLKIGVKSTAIKFTRTPQKILYSLISTHTFLLVLVGLLTKLEFSYYILITLGFFHLSCQIKTCDFNDSPTCLKKFKSNIWVGIIILAAIILG